MTRALGKGELCDADKAEKWAQPDQHMMIWSKPVNNWTVNCEDVAKGFSDEEIKRECCL
jgi:hypothetical protein